MQILKYLHENHSPFGWKTSQSDENSTVVLMFNEKRCLYYHVHRRYLLSDLLSACLKGLLLFAGVIHDVPPSNQQLALHRLATTTHTHTHTHPVSLRHRP